MIYLLIIGIVLMIYFMIKMYHAIVLTHEEQVLEKIAESKTVDKNTNIEEKEYVTLPAAYLYELLTTSKELQDSMSNHMAKQKKVNDLTEMLKLNSKSTYKEKSYNEDAVTYNN